jgi:hypothetical protein
MHESEFASLCTAEVEFAMAGGQPEGAHTWVDMLETYVPDHPTVDLLRRHIQGSGKLKAWRRRRN